MVDMITGFEKIVEERIKQAQEKGAFDNLSGSGQPLVFEDDRHVAEDLRLAYKILKNADCLPPEIEIKKEIQQTEALLAQMKNTESKYRILKKLNYLIMKLNASREGSVQFDMPQRYADKVVDRIETGKTSHSG
jgi:hypothetical protein